MHANDYQKLAARTLIDSPVEISPRDFMLIWNAVGLAGECGEVVDYIKKGIFHQHGIEDGKLKKEIGDLLWYIAGICTVRGYSLADVMQENIDKLRSRYPNGYSAEDSKARKE